MMENLEERFVFRTIDLNNPQEAEYAAYMESVCLPPSDACTREEILDRAAAAPELFLVAGDRETGKLAGILNGVAAREVIMFRSFRVQIILFVVAFVFTAGIVFPANATSKIINNPYMVPSDNSTAVGINGSFVTDQQEALDKINEYRLEACKNGYRDPRNSSRKLTEADYVPMTWSSRLETYARIRAAESACYMSHSRPGGNVELDEENHPVAAGNAESIAWGPDTMTGGVKSWYREKSDWVNGGSGVTGHYTTMINPHYTTVGLGCFVADGIYGGMYKSSICGEFGDENYAGEETMAEAETDITQVISIFTSYLSAPKLIETSGNSEEPQEGTFEAYQLDMLAFDVLREATFPDKKTAYVNDPDTTYDFSSSAPSVLYVSSDGNAVSLKAGTAVVTAESSSGTSYTAKVKVDSEFSKPITIRTKKKGKQLTVTIKANSANEFYDGYQIQIAGNRKFTEGLKEAAYKLKKKEDGQSEKQIRSKIFKKVKNKGACYVRVRAYMEYDGQTLCSAWSEVKKVK